MKKLILSALSIALLLSGCASDRTGNLRIYLTDKPIDIGDAKEIKVTISEISVQKAKEAFLTVWSGTKEYDLLALQNKPDDGAALILEEKLEKGTYTQIRLVVVSGQIVIKGEPPHDMTVPSSQVKIPLVFNIMEDASTEIVLDFEAEHSIHVVNAGLSEKYILSPVIRVKSISISN